MIRSILLGTALTVLFLLVGCSSLPAPRAAQIAASHDAS